MDIVITLAKWMFHVVIAFTYSFIIMNLLNNITPWSTPAGTTVFIIVLMGWVAGVGYILWQCYKWIYMSDE